MISGAIVRTIAGDISPANLGRTNYHEHAFQVTPLLVGDELNSTEKSAKEFLRLANSGFDAYLDATPLGLGRRPEEISKIADASGLKIVHATGVHKEAHYAGKHRITSCSVDELVELFNYEIKTGMLKDDSLLSIEPSNTSAIKAGFIKFGISNEPLTDFEKRALQAAAQISAQSGIAIMVHTDAASEIFGILDQLESFGLDLSKVVMAHIDRRPDLKFHSEIVKRGALLGYDGAGRSQYFPDEVLIELFAEMANLGLESKILLGGDVARSSRYIEYGGGPGLSYLGDSFLPALRERTSEEIVSKVLTTNPANWLAFNP